MPCALEVDIAEEHFGTGGGIYAESMAETAALLDYGEVELSNNLAENSMRPVTLGRKNWLHVGSAQAGPKVAAIFSVIESCRRLGVPTKDYLLDVLPGMNRRTRSEYTQLTPARWLSTHR